MNLLTPEDVIECFFETLAPIIAVLALSSPFLIFGAGLFWRLFHV